MRQQFLLWLHASRGASVRRKIQMMIMASNAAARAAGAKFDHSFVQVLYDGGIRDVGARRCLSAARSNVILFWLNHFNLKFIFSLFLCCFQDKIHPHGRPVSHMIRKLDTDAAISIHSVVYRQDVGTYNPERLEYIYSVWISMFGGEDHADDLEDDGSIIDDCLDEAQRWGPYRRYQRLLKYQRRGFRINGAKPPSEWSSSILPSEW